MTTKKSIKIFVSLAILTVSVIGGCHYLLPNPLTVLSGSEYQSSKGNVIGEKNNEISPYSNELTAFTQGAGDFFVCSWTGPQGLSSTGRANYAEKISVYWCDSVRSTLPLSAGLMWTKERTKSPMVSLSNQWDGAWDGVIIKMNGGHEIGRVAYRDNILFDGKFAYFSSINVTSFFSSIYENKSIKRH